MSTPLNESQSDRLTLVIRRVPELTAGLADAVYEVAQGDCEIGLRDNLLYIELPMHESNGWARTPAIIAAVRHTVADAELVRVEVADMITAAERSHEPLRSSA